VHDSSATSRRARQHRERRAPRLAAVELDAGQHERAAGRQVAQRGAPADTHQRARVREHVERLAVDGQRAVRAAPHEQHVAVQRGVDRRLQAREVPPTGRVDDEHVGPCGRSEEHENDRQGGDRVVLHGVSV
jgi:microcystin-dependent protein